MSAGVLMQGVCLFADGAGAAVLSNQPFPPPPRRMEFADSRLVTRRTPTRSGLGRGTECLREHFAAAGSAGRASDVAAKLLSDSLVAAGVQRNRSLAWITHGRARGDSCALREKLKLSEADVRHSSAVLREFGNISSPTVYFVPKPPCVTPCPTASGGCPRSARVQLPTAALLEVKGFEPVGRDSVEP